MTRTYGQKPARVFSVLFPSDPSQLLWRERAFTQPRRCQKGTCSPTRVPALTVNLYSSVHLETTSRAVVSLRHTHTPAPWRVLEGTRTETGTSFPNPAKSKILNPVGWSWPHPYAKEPHPGERRNSGYRLIGFVVSFHVCYTILFLPPLYLFSFFLLPLGIGILSRGSDRCIKANRVIQRKLSDRKC